MNVLPRSFPCLSPPALESALMQTPLVSVQYHSTGSRPNAQSHAEASGRHIENLQTPTFSRSQQAKRRRVAVQSTGPQDEGTRLLEEDMQRYSNKDRGRQSQEPSSMQEEEKAGGGAKDFLDKVLIGDFFFVLLALAWLALGVAEKSTLKSSRLLDIWFPLWTLIFQPAIGVLMLGAVLPYLPISMVGSFAYRMVTKKKTIILLLLEKHRVNSLDLRMKILDKLFVSREQVEPLLLKRDLSDYDRPEKWDWDDISYILDAPYGGLCATTLKGFSVNWVQCKWLREVCYVLGLKYFDGGPGISPGYRKCRVAVPNGWTFDPNRPVFAKWKCSTCDYTYRGGGNEALKMSWSKFRSRKDV